MKILTDEERSSCHSQFRKNDLFRHWMPILSELENNVTHLDAISLWYNANEVLQKIRTEERYRDEMIVFIHSEMARKDNAPCLTCIMAIVITCLMNAAEEGHEEEDIPNDAICIAIMRIYKKDKLFDALITEFFRRKIGNDGKRVVITPSDPMTQNISLDDMDDVAKREVESYRDKVLELTKGLKVYFTNWDSWQELWTQICMDAELVNLLKKIEPRNNEWGLNQKMICNVIGIFLEVCQISTPKSTINNTLSSKNLSSYISNYRDDGSNASINKEQYNKIKSLTQLSQVEFTEIKGDRRR